MAIILKKGSKGEDVKKLQKLLNLYPDGIFGAITEERVKDFQKSKGLTPDGVVGPATWSMLVPFVFKKSKRQINEIIVHCTATPEGRETTVEEIRKWHKAQGWSDIGYHYVVYLDGSIHNGRDVDIVGSHCSGHNSKSIGVVYVGGLAKDGKTAKDTRTPAQKEGLLTILNMLREAYPKAKIYGHRNFSNKACPSFDAKTEYKDI